MRNVVTTFLDALGLAALAGFAWFIWPPAAFLVIGASLLFVSWQMSRRP